LYRAAEVPWPAGSYLGSIVEAVHHNRSGHPALLFGEKSQLGWWYYFPCVAVYKVPMGFWPVLLLGLASLAWRRVRWAEVSLLAPAVVWSLLLLTSHINIGFRHALPAYVMWMMLAARCVAPAGSAGWNGLRLVVAWGGVAFATVHVLSYHPDYLSYVNFPRLRAGSADKPYWAINDSNIDWGQGLKQIKAWMDAHPQPGRKVYLGLTPSSPWLASVPQSVSYYLGADRALTLRADLPPPTEGLLILSPVWEYGIYEEGNRYGFLKGVPPVDVIGHCTPVYDLDALKAARPSSRPAQ